MRTKLLLLFILIGMKIASSQTTPASVNKDTTAFRVAVGARFTFFADEKSTKLYYDVTGYIPSIFSKDKPTWKNFGAFVSLDENNFEFNFSTGDASSNNGTITVLDEPYIASVKNTNSVSIANNSYTRTISTEKTHQTRLSLYPLYKIGDNQFVHLQLESIYGTSKRKFTDILLGTDTSFISLDSSKHLPRASFPYKVSEGYTVNSISTFTGIGFIIIHKYKTIQFQLMPSAGYFSNEYFYKSYGGGAHRYRDNDVYIACRFALYEVKSGIKIGGDARAFLKEKSFNYSIYISKQFTLNKLSDFLKSP